MGRRKECEQAHGWVLCCHKKTRDMREVETATDGYRGVAKEMEVNSCGDDDAIKE